MSYRVFVGSTLMYDPALPEDGYILTDQKIVTQVNKAGSYSFKIGPENPAYGLINQLTTTVTAYRGNRLELFGRVLHCDKDMQLRKEVFVEGNAAFLNDSVVRPYTYKGSVEGYFSMLLTNHNSQVEAGKRFAVGRCEITDPNNLIVRESSDYPTTRAEMDNKLIGLLGGYLVPRFEDETWYMDYLESPGGTGGQVIEFGHNLLDLKEYVTAEDVYTCLIPIGADDGSGNRVDIKSVNNGLDYLESATGIALFGRIWKMLTWEDVTLPANLKAKGQEELAAAIMKKTTITVKAVDLAALGVDTDAIWTGWRYRVKSEPHALDMYMTVSKAEIDPQDVANNTYTFGAIITTLTDRQTGQVKQSAAGIEEQVKAIEAKTTDASEKLENLILRVNDINDKYAEQQDFEDFCAAYDLKVEDFEQRIQALEGGGE